MIAPIDQGNRQLAHLRWLCRRGVKELDLAFERFLERYYDRLQASEVQCFQNMLEASDVQLLSWLFAHSEPADPMTKMLFERIRRCAVVDDPA